MFCQPPKTAFLKPHVNVLCDLSRVPTNRAKHLSSAHTFQTALDFRGAELWAFSTSKTILFCVPSCDMTAFPLAQLKEPEQSITLLPYWFLGWKTWQGMRAQISKRWGLSLTPSCFSLVRRSIPRLLVTACHTRRNLFPCTRLFFLHIRQKL